MIRNQCTCNRALLVSLGLCAAAWSHDAAAQGYPQPHSLQWPLYESKVVNNSQVGGPGSTNPRPAVGNVVGEAQIYDPPFLHSGADIRGVFGDPVYVVRSGNVWFRANFSENSQDCVSATTCRLYVKGDDGFIYYYSHLRLDKSAPEYTVSLEAAILAANARDLSQGTYPVKPNTGVKAGQLLTSIADFPSWNHLHFGMVDSNDGYRIIDPLTALTQSPSGASGNFTIVDDERPIVASLHFVTDGASRTEALPSGDCRQISGKLDIAAQMRDSFYSKGPAPSGLSGDFASIGVSSANYTVRRAKTGESVQQGNWANFVRFPICSGSDAACPQSLNEAQFVAHSINTSDGSLSPGQDYVDRLYWVKESCSQYINAGAADAAWTPGSGGACTGERYIHLLTNNITTDGAWDTSSMQTGRYEVTAEAVDAAGNRAALSTFVTVNNGGDLNATVDAYVRDNSRDLGNLPSTSGNMPFWVSPDIVVAVENSTPPTSPDAAGQVRIVANQTYDVYVFVHNDTCVDLSGVRVEVFSANPALIQKESDWVHVTDGYEGAPGSSTGIPVPHLGITRMGPYKWTPTDDEASQNNGHRCMLALIDAPSDPVQKDVNHVADDNNIAQLNLQIDSTSFRFVGDDSGVGLDFDCGNFPAGEPGAQVTLILDTGSYSDIIAGKWNSTLGAAAVKNGNKVFVDFSLCSVQLPALAVPSNTVLPGEVEVVLPSGYYGTYTVTLSETINNVEQGGQAFSVSRFQSPPIN